MLEIRRGSTSTDAIRGGIDIMRYWCDRQSSMGMIGLRYCDALGLAVKNVDCMRAGVDVQ